MLITVDSCINLHAKIVDMHKIACLNDHMIVNVRCTRGPVISSAPQGTEALLYVLKNIETVATPSRDRAHG